MNRNDAKAPADKLDTLAQPAPAATTEPAENAGSATTEDQHEVIEDDGLAPQNEPEAAAGANNASAADTSPDKGEVHPTTAEAYIDTTEAWILAATNAAVAESRWKSEMPLRRRLGVSVDDTNALVDKLAPPRSSPVDDD